MKEIKRVFMQYQPYDFDGMESRLEDLAGEGWQFEKTGAWTWKFRRDEPKETKYSLVYLPKASAYDPADDDERASFDEFIRASGWEKRGEAGKMVIYSNDSPDPVPIETGESIRLQNIRSAMMTSFLLPYILLVILLGINGSIAQIFTDPETTFSSYLALTASFTTSTAVVLLIADIIVYMVWLNRAKKAVECGRGLPETKRYGNIQRKVLIVFFVLFGISLLLMAWHSEAGNAGWILGLILVIAVIIPLSHMFTDKMREKGLARNKTRIISFAATFIVTFAVIFFVTWHVATEAENDSAGSYDGAPFVLADIVDIDERTLDGMYDHSETVFMERDWLWQDDDDHDIDYEILKVKKGRLYDRCLNSFLRKGSGLPIDYGDREFKEVTDSRWGAEKVYEFNEDGYRLLILAYDNGIVRLEADEDTAEKIPKDTFVSILR